jgi:uncharacterized membrane protein YccC
MGQTDRQNVMPVLPPVTVAGFPLNAWAFAGRTWLALILALYAAFWLQLESPGSAALTVASLAFPLRGQGMEKAAFRVCATVVGLIAAVAITGLFSQTEWLLITVIAAWIGLCVYVSSLFDGFRTYAAVLCIITVCLIAVEQLDTPQNVFDLGMQRGAAIVIGILSVALVNAVFSAPDYYPVIATRLEALRGKVTAQTSRAMIGETAAPAAFAALLKEITALRPEITSLAAESSSGPTRGAAARTAMVDLVFALAATRTLSVLRNAFTRSAGNQSSPGFYALDWMVAEQRRRNQYVAASLAALHRSASPGHTWRAPFYRSHRIALANGTRAFVYFLLAAFILMTAGWPSTSVSLAFVGILIGLSAMSPNQGGASVLALVAVVIGCLLAGTLEFVVLNGVTAYPLLAIGLIPFVTVPALLMTIPNPALISFGRSNLVFTMAIFSPSNPQSYNPQTFLFSCIFLSVAAVLVFICQQALPPLSIPGRLRILLAEARRDLARAADRQPRGASREEAMFRDAVRIGQIAGLVGEGESHGATIDAALECFDRTAALRLASASLAMLPNKTPAGLRNKAAAAISGADAPAMLAVADELAFTNPTTHPSRDNAAAALAVAAIALGARPADPGEERP